MCASLFQCKHCIVCIVASVVWKVQVTNEMLLNTWLFLFFSRWTVNEQKLLFIYLVGLMIFWYCNSVFPLSLEAENIFRIFWYLSLCFHLKKDKLKSLIPLFNVLPDCFHSTISSFSVSHYLPVELIFLLFLRSFTTLLASSKPFPVLLLLSVTFLSMP